MVQDTEHPIRSVRWDGYAPRVPVSETDVTDPGPLLAPSYCSQPGQVLNGAHEPKGDRGVEER